MDPSLLIQMLDCLVAPERKQSPWPGLWEKDQGANPQPEQVLPSSFGAGQVGVGCFKPPQPLSQDSQEPGSVPI